MGVNFQWGKGPKLVAIIAGWVIFGLIVLYGYSKYMGWI